MSDWSDGWYRDQKPGVPGGQASAGIPGVSHPAVQAPPGGWPDQPSSRSGGAGVRSSQPAGPGGTYGGGGSPRSRRRWGPRRIMAIVALVVVVVLLLGVGTYFYLDSKLTRANVLVDYSGRPVAAAGQTWLITGSDSRQGLTRKQERQLATGVGIAGHRSDTILLLHIPPSGPAVLVSVPRDSYVPIPGYGSNKINAAFSFGGPKLLAKTLQNATGLRIDHYMGIGFGGLVHVVDAVGGVRMCIPSAMNDPAAGLHLKKGCQNLDGAQALGFVRTRHLFATQDLQREADQRLFIKALLRKMTSAGTLVNPFAALPAANGAASALTVDNGTHLYQLMQVAFALRSPETTTVPIGSQGYVANAGDVIYWDKAQASQMFNDMKTGKAIPKNLISGSKTAVAG